MSHTVLKIICIVILAQISLFAQAENLSLEANVSSEKGPRLKLVLNEEYLITHLLAKKVSAQNLAAKDIIAVQKLAIKMDPTTYRQFQNYKDPDVVKSAEYLCHFDFKIGPAEKKLSQIQDSTTNNLVLMMNGKETLFKDLYL